MHFPEFYRLRADFLLMKSDREDLESIEADYRQAIEVSKQFNALMQELRAATRLGRLLQSQGRSGEARALLAPLYARFTEGFDTPDLIEAKILLDDFPKAVHQPLPPNL
jgi:predicted ATPase